MKVILLEDVKNVGFQGDIITVSDGYGRNYLIPNKKAVEATHANVNIIEQQKKLAEHRYKNETEKAKGIADKLASAEITIALKAGKDDRLYGSVTSADIAEKLSEKGIEIDKKQIIHTEPIKALGKYTIEIKLLKDIVGKVTLNVEKEEG